MSNDPAWDAMKDEIEEEERTRTLAEKEEPETGEEKPATEPQTWEVWQYGEKIREITATFEEAIGQLDGDCMELIPATQKREKAHETREGRTLFVCHPRTCKYHCWSEIEVLDTEMPHCCAYNGRFVPWIRIGQGTTDKRGLLAKGNISWSCMSVSCGWKCRIETDDDPNSQDAPKYCPYRFYKIRWMKVPATGFRLDVDGTSLGTIDIGKNRIHVGPEPEVKK